ncbi:unnamed protein product, partial [Durusdinium trenchii]
MADYENAKACLQQAKVKEAFGDHHRAVVLFSRGECLAGHDSTKRKCARGFRRALQHLEEQLSGKYHWEELYKADPLALVGSPKPLAKLCITAYSEPVVPIQSKVHGRGLAARRDTAIGELLFVDKAWLLGTNDQLLNSAFATLDDCDELQKHRFLSLFDGQHAAPVVDELLPGRVARSVPEVTGQEADHERVTRILRLNRLSRWSLHQGEPSDASDASAEGSNAEGSGVAGVWILGAMVNHSCRPNVSFTFLGDVLTCRATRALKAGDELLCSYCRIDRPWTMRQKELSENYDFTCHCDRCVLEEAFLPDVPKILKDLHALTKVPQKRMSLRWVERWSSLYRQIEYDISLSIKQHGKRLDE